MNHTLTRLIPAAVAGALLAGCATVPGDPYYYGSSGYGVYEQPGYIYNSGPVYVSPPPAVYVPPPPVYYGNRERNQWRDHDRDRADRARYERERREQQARDAAQRERERARDQARRDQAERDRRAAEDRRQRPNNPGVRPSGRSADPHPHDWRARQYSNTAEPGAGP